MSMTKVDRAGELRPGNYFTRIRTDKEWKAELPKGQLVLLTGVEGDKVSYTVIGGDGKRHSFNTTPDDFLSEHLYEPDGRAIRDEQLKQALMESRDIADIISAEADQLRGIEEVFKPRALVGVDIEASPDDQPPVEGSNGQGLMRVEVKPGQMLERAKQWISGVAERRNGITERKKQLEAVRARVESLLKEQQAWAEALSVFKDMTDKLNDIIGDLNLYLGNGEEILQLRNGKPADASVPLTVRQLVLFMDEECALESEHGGIDAYSMEQFDEWLLADEAHLNQVLPEAKGVVCLKPRRHSKRYSEDEVVNARLNAPNHETYVLIRNGENLYRVCPPWEVRSYFFPTRDEFKDAFMTADWLSKREAERRGVDVTGWGDDDRRSVTVPVEPGSYEFEKVSKKVDSSMAYYSKALIMLQGIVDRTGIFPEYRDMGLSLIDVTQWTDHLRFVHDADPAFLLTTGQETFSRWMSRTSKQLQVGDRVIGLFRKLVQESRNDKDDHRVYPSNASWPDDYELYTIEGKQDGGWKILYNRTDKIGRWKTVPSDHPMAGKPYPGKPGYVYKTHVREWVEEPPKTKAVLRIEPGDDYILAYDVITLEEVDRFLTDRLSRHSYQTMFELLKRVRNMKRVEREEEEPFITLCVGEAMKLEPSMTETELRPQILQAIHWYKFKNKVHRAIKDDYPKALRMVMQQWRAVSETQPTGDPLDDVRPLMTDATVAVFMRKSYITVVDRENEGRVFVHIKRYYRTKSGFTCYQDERFKTVGNWYVGWEMIHSTDDWGSWVKGARAKRDFLTPSEYAWLFKAAEPAMREKLINVFGRTLGDYWGEGRAEAVKVELLSVSINVSRGLKCKYSTVFKYEGKTERVIISASATWSRNKGMLSFSDVHARRGDTYGLESLPAKLDKVWDPTKNDTFVTYINEVELGKIKKAATSKKREDERRNSASWAARNIGIKVHEELKRINEEAAKQRYLEAFGDPLNWDSFKKDERRSGIDPVNSKLYDWMVDGVKRLLIDRKIKEEDLLDKTLEDLMAMLRSHGVDIDGNAYKQLLIKTGIDQKFIPDPDRERLKREAAAGEVKDDTADEDEENMVWEHPD